MCVVGNLKYKTGGLCSIGYLKGQNGPDGLGCPIMALSSHLWDQMTQVVQLAIAIMAVSSHLGDCLIQERPHTVQGHKFELDTAYLKYNTVQCAVFRQFAVCSRVCAENIGNCTYNMAFSV